ncbi:HPr family phosphocarrier protein [Oceanibaculum pacificum]|uniref:Phosphate ABC transporter permease n=1 Tax=Oceanibaculum pacificum TaxID=580166 RepID=A0A154WFM3_9PROT|nr:HPr family phosphocarrier protein [Oceanibaculum pacificum]KZD12299.1 phosphate ABC transporter permease [Oceanibaculum pacificum]
MTTAAAVSRTLTILNKRGLHARAAAKFVKLADLYEADIQVSKSGTTVSGLSIMGLMMLAAAPGSTIDVTATGPQAAEAVDAIDQLVADKFGEE